MDEVSRAEWRSQAYHWLSRAFLSGWGGGRRMTPEGLRTLAWEAGALAEAAPEGFQALSERFHGLSGLFWTTTAAEREAEYRKAIGHTIAKDCPPYETLYGVTQVDFQQPQILADIAGFYRAFGFRLSPKAAERVDHVAVELEFLHLMAAKEAYALSRGEEEHVRTVREGEAAFLGDHLGRWGGTFGVRLGRRAPEGIYGLWGALLADVLEADARHLGLGSLDPMEVAEAAVEPPGPMECLGAPQGGEEDA